MSDLSQINKGGSFIPSEEFPLGDGRPWTPPVWAQKSQGLIAQAKENLFADQNHVNNNVLGGGDTAMAGPQTAPQNESDQLISGPTRGHTWSSTIDELRRNAPVVWENMDVGEPNPNT